MKCFLKQADQMVSLLMELVPGVVVIALTGTLIYNFVAEENTQNQAFRDWATNLVALYVGKSISDQAQQQAARQQRALHEHDQPTYSEITTLYEEEPRGLPEDKAPTKTPRGKTTTRQVSRRKGTR